MPGWGFILLIFPVLLGFLLASALFCFKRWWLLSIYAFLVPIGAGWGSWGGLLAVTSLHLEHLMYFDQHPHLAVATLFFGLTSGGLFGVAAAGGVGFSLSWVLQHAG